MPEKKYEVCVESFSASALIENEALWASYKIFDENRDTSFFFSSSHHVRCWLKTLPSETLFALSMLIDSDGELSGLTLLSISKTRLLKFIPIVTLSLLRTGNSSLDQCWPEYVRPACKKEVDPYVGWWLAETQIKLNAGMLVTEMVPVEWLEQWSSKTPFGYQILAENIESGGVIKLRDPLLWSSSIRRQCRQTEKFSEDACGDQLNFSEVVGSLAKREILQGAAPWHVRKWEGTPTPSGFLNQTFNKTLKGWSCLTGRTRMRVFTAYAGEDLMGVNVILQDGVWSGYYLSCLRPERSNHCHVGTWMHVRTCELLALEGEVDTYDFMAGQARYKSQLRHADVKYAKGVWFNSQILSGKLIGFLYKIRNKCNIIKQY